MNPSSKIPILHARLTKTHDPNTLRDILLLLSPASPSALLSYARCLFLPHAPSAHPFPWNALIRLHSLSSPLAFSLFSSMHRRGVPLDLHTLPSLLPAASLPLLLGAAAHALSLKLNLLSLHSSNSLVSFYGRHSLSSLSLLAFLEIPSEKRDLVSWSALVSAMASSGRNMEALEAFRIMQACGEAPDEVVMVTTASAAAAASPESVVWVYCYVRRRRLRLTAVLGSALVVALARVGRISLAKEVFDEMPERNLIARTALVAGLGAHGMGDRAVEIFSGMGSDDRERPDRVAFLEAMIACSRAGMVDEGLRLFESMKGEYGLEPMMEHYGCVVDLLGRAGMVYEAHEFIKRIPFRPGPVVWRILLGACVAHGYVDLAEQVRGELAGLDPGHDGDDVLLSNVYGWIERWRDKEVVRAKMVHQGVVKTPGRSACLPM